MGYHGMSVNQNFNLNCNFKWCRVGHNFWSAVGNSCLFVSELGAIFNYKC